MQLWKKQQAQLGPVLDNSILWETSDSKYLKDNGNKISMLVSPETILVEMSGLVGFNDLKYNKESEYEFFSTDTTEHKNFSVSRQKINKINDYSFVTPIWGKTKISNNTYTPGIHIPCMTWFGDLWSTEGIPYLYLAKFPGKDENTSSYYDIPLINNLSGDFFNWGIFCGLKWDESEIVQVITFPSKYDTSGKKVNEVKPSFIRENNPDKNFGHPDDVPYGRYTYYDWENETFIPSIYIDIYPVEN